MTNTETRFHSEKNATNSFIVLEKKGIIQFRIRTHRIEIDEINLTIKDAELLMDELHRVISQIEGGK